MPSFLDQIIGPTRPAPTGRSFLDDILEDEAPDPEYGWGDTIISGGLRVVPSVVGSLGGGAAGAAAGGVGAVPGAVAGGAAGGALGEWLAQQYEQYRGLRDETSLGAIGAEAILGAVPLGKSATLARAGLKGAGMAAGGTALHRYMEEGELPELDELALSGGVGAVFGAGAEGLARRLANRSTPLVDDGTRAYQEFTPEDIARRTATMPPTAEPRVTEFTPEEIAARQAAVPRSRGEQFLDELLDDEYRYEDAQPRLAARDPNAFGAGIFPERPVSAEPTSPFGPNIYDEADVVARTGPMELPTGQPRYDPQLIDPIELKDPYAGPAAGRGFADYAATEPAILREAAIDAADSQRGFEAPIPERMLPPPPEPARWEDASPRAATPAEQALRWLVPSRTLKGPGISELSEQTAREAAEQPSPLQRLFGEQRGELSGELTSTLAGGGVGALAGGAIGDTPEERIGGAVAGGVAGAAGAGALARFMRRPRVDPSTIVHAERPLPATGEPIPPIRGAETPTGRFIIENDHKVFEFEPDNRLPRATKLPESQRDDYGLGNFPEESRGAIGDVLDTFSREEIEAARGGRQSMERTEALARRMQLDVEKGVAPGKNLTRPGHMAFAKAFESTAMRAKQLGLKARADGLTDREQAELLMLDQANKSLGLSYLGLRSEAGGTLNVYRHLKRLMPGELRLITEMIDRGRLHKDMANLANLYADLPNDPVAAFEKLREVEAARRTISDKITSYYTANILSGFKTQLRNLFGNASRLASRLPTKVAAGAFEGFINRGGRPREVYTREVTHELQGAFAGFDRAWRDGLETLKLGFSRQGLENEGLEDLTSLYIPRPEFKGGGKNPLNYPGRLMAGVDRFFRQLNSSMELYSRTYATARREAERQSLDGAAFNDFVARRVAELRMNPSIELRRQVARAAERGVYQEDPGVVANSLTSLTRKWPAARFVMPFIGTVSNIMKQGIEHSPFGFFMSRARQSNDLRERAIARGEALFGTAALAPIAYLAATGRLSGAGPSDPSKRAALYESGWRPHSIRVPGGFIGDSVAQALGATRSDDGDYWVSYTLAQPIAVQAAIVANGFEAWEEAGSKDSGSTESIISSTIARAGKSALDQSFLSGVGDLIDALNDPSAADKFFGRLAQGFIPLSGLARNVTQTVDRTVRDPEGIIEHVEANVPGLSTLVDPRLTRFGEDVEREGTSALWAPEAEPVQHDWINDELSRLGVNVGMPSERLQAPTALGGQKIAMSDEDALELRRFRGRSVRANLSAVMGAPGYESLPDYVRADLLRRAVRDASGDASDAARMAHLLQRPDFIRLLAEPVENVSAASYR